LSRTESHVKEESQFNDSSSAQQSHIQDIPLTVEFEEEKFEVTLPVQEEREFDQVVLPISDAIEDSAAVDSSNDSTNKTERQAWPRRTKALEEAQHMSKPKRSASDVDDSISEENNMIFGPSVSDQIDHEEQKAPRQHYDEQHQSQAQEEPIQSEDALPDISSEDDSQQIILAANASSSEASD
jgi:hypothetical protein